MIFERSILNFYKKTLLKRHDPNGLLYYFSKEDFPSLKSESFSFNGNLGQRLLGEIYYKGEMRTDRLVIFEHGLGCGHAAYMREIDVITERGYTVATYDHTGTYHSEGEHIGGFSQSVCDLEYCISALRSDERFKESSLSVIGHSWGGFSAMNSPAICPEITHTVAISGFISPRDIQEQFLTGILKFYRAAVYKTELDAFPKHAVLNGCDTLKNASTKALIIHSKDDPTVSYEKHFMKLKEALKDNPNVEFLTLDGKGHNPNYTKDAVEYEAACIKELRRKLKKKELSTDEAKANFRNSYDWHRMTEQDEDVWNKIFEFLEK